VKPSWTDGTPTAKATSDGYYYSGYKAGVGFSFTVPADTTERTVSFIAGACNNGTTDVSAHLSDGSSPDYVDKSMSYQWSCPGVMGLYTLKYRAASASQTLTITVSSDPNQMGEVWLSGAALQ
jgi:hypothetical protein